MNPDRLEEERERQMTIDLGFAWLTLPSGTEVSVVDVPGHEDFVKNMLAGVGGIDLTLFVVAADEGVMPQTREHLAIVNLLRIPSGVIALTKADLVTDPDWLDLVTEDVRDLVRDTVLADAAIVPVSAVTGQGLPDLLAELDRLTTHATPRRDISRPRLPIDRVFSISGFGTVVTGTLSDGTFAVGDDVAILPGEQVSRIRGLQTHKTKVAAVAPGFRVAMNLGRTATEDLVRGQVVVRPGTVSPTQLLDARLDVLADLDAPLAHDTLLDFYVGAAHVEAHVRLLDADALAPGETGLVQFRLSAPVVTARDDRYIVRLPSPSTTVGGGAVLNAHPGRRHRRHNPEVLSALAALEMGDPQVLLPNLLGPRRVLRAADLLAQSDLDDATGASALAALIERGIVIPLAADYGAQSALARAEDGLVSAAGWQALAERIVSLLHAYHQRYPLRLGMPREELKSRLGLPAMHYAGLLARAESEGIVRTGLAWVALPGHRVALSLDQNERVEQLLVEFRASPYAPPGLAQAQEAVGADVLDYLLDAGILVKVTDEVAFEADAREEMERRVVALARKQGEITVAQVRDLFDTSRKYALGLLEDLDRRRVTKRVGDARVAR